MADVDVDVEIKSHQICKIRNYPRTQCKVNPI